MKQSDIDNIYRKKSPEEIPWNIEEPPQALVELIEGGKLQPCKTLDLGCGIGNHAIYLAAKGFDVTGVDISPTAIGFAKEKSREKGVRCHFIVADVLGGMREVKETFDFVYDWELLHHIFPEQREKYVQNVFGKLNPNGHYLSVCFSEKDTQFGGSGKCRKTSLGTVLYFSCEDEVKALFEPYFHIDELRTIEISGKSAPHLAIFAFMVKR
jgi:SAM-dependent methyltransferase